LELIKLNLFIKTTAHKWRATTPNVINNTQKIMLLLKTMQIHVQSMIEFNVNDSDAHCLS